MLRLIAQKYFRKFLFLFWLVVTSPPLLVFVWLIHSHENLQPWLSWLGLPLGLAWLLGSLWLGMATARHLFEEKRLFLDSLRRSLTDLRLQLALMPIIGILFMPDEDKTKYDDDDASYVRPLRTPLDYQLVLQFRGDSLADFDAMIALEDDLTERLGDSADVDGHDFGSGTGNIFIFTSDPAATFDRARPVLERRQHLQTVTAAYREVEGEHYTVIWPEGSRAEFSLL